jgi:hypothetical protein
VETMAVEPVAVSVGVAAVVEPVVTSELPWEPPHSVA